MNIHLEIAKINQSNMTPVQKEIAMSDLRLRAYNAWLGDATRELGTVYPGFPGDAALPVIADKPVQAKAVRIKPAGGTKLQQARALYQENIGVGRDTMIQMFVNKLGMSKAGATTYYYSSKKHLG